MGYVAIKGGEKAILNSINFFNQKMIGDIKEKEINESLVFSVDKVMSEGALYTKKLAAKAIKKSGGDLLNAAFFVRAHRSSCQRIGIAKCIDTQQMKLIRRISSAFKDIQGGQILGPSNDYQVKLFIKEDKKDINLKDFSSKTNILKSALDPLRKENLIKTVPKDDKPFDITREHPKQPYARSAVMQTLTRGESGSMLGFAYTTMRGYGDIHPTIGDLRLGVCDVEFMHPFIKKEVKVAEINVTACESVGNFEKQDDESVKLTVGYGFCFGFNETKAISMSILDLTLYNKQYSVSTQNFANDFEMIVAHIDGIDSMGFTNHFKLPHYVTFQADLQILKRVSSFMKGDR